MSVTTMGVKLDQTTRQRLRNLAELTRRSPHWLMKAAIDEYLDREEALQKERQEDRERWQRYTESGEYISHADMVVWLEGLAELAVKKTND